MKGVKENCGQERQFFILSVYFFSYFPVIPSFSQLSSTISDATV